ncbi:hypothetical protein GCM10011583_31060 [Streptomyces camponoticapitis]|uniref:Uncharacterized protein n=1 Tax=Streptomyces camponoticapitis TaxID=1616125 RepID=A0ABQ2E6L6_9ACTN|nr:hypothetical protein GCM10011583_31060 [Streptomyces camponoticapitis]
MSKSFVVIVATAIGDLPARWWNPHEHLQFYRLPLTIAPGQTGFEGHRGLLARYPEDMPRALLYSPAQHVSRGGGARCAATELSGPSWPSRPSDPRAGSRPYNGQIL